MVSGDGCEVTPPAGVGAVGPSGYGLTVSSNGRSVRSLVGTEFALAECGGFLFDGGREDVEVGDDVGVGEQAAAEGVGDGDDGDPQGVAWGDSARGCMLRTGAPRTRPRRLLTAVTSLPR